MPPAGVRCRSTALPITWCIRSSSTSPTQNRRRACHFTRSNDSYSKCLASSNLCASSYRSSRYRGIAVKTLPVINRPRWLTWSAWPWPTYALDHDHGRLAVTDIGDGPPLLFVHVGSWSFVWRDVLIRLQRDFRCVTVDAPGCGLSDRTRT